MALSSYVEVFVSCSDADSSTYLDVFPDSKDDRAEFPETCLPSMIRVCSRGRTSSTSVTATPMSSLFPQRYQ